MDAWLSCLGAGDEFGGPPFLQAETISAIRRLTFRGMVSPENAREAVRDFLALRIATPAPPPLYTLAFELAERYQQPTIYDTCYLALAEILSCEFITLDRRLYRSVTPTFRRIRLIE